MLALIGLATVVWWATTRGLPGFRWVWEAVPHKLAAAWMFLLAMLVFFMGMRVIHGTQQVVALGFGHLAAFLTIWAGLFLGGRLLVSVLRNKK
jgi:hypothetical protein